MHGITSFNDNANVLNTDFPKLNPVRILVNPGFVNILTFHKLSG